MDKRHQVISNETIIRSNRSNFALGIIGGCMIGTFALTSPFIIMQLRSPLPYMATPRRKVLAALEEISKINRQRMQGNQTTEPVKQLRYYDLGSGDGETVLAAASTQEWKATGIELNSTLWVISMLRRMFSPRNVRQMSHFIWGDIWKQKVSDADAIMIFGVKPLMPIIAKKIASECRPGTFVMSYRFHVPLHSAAQMNSSARFGWDDKGALGAELVYDHEEMRIYELRDDTVANIKRHAIDSLRSTTSEK
jgi:hypothetical protein